MIDADELWGSACERYSRSPEAFCAGYREAEADVGEELSAARELLAKASTALHLVIGWASVAHAKWDSDEDHRVGKMLAALAGDLKRYSPDTDKIHSVLDELDAAEKARDRQWD
jgi:hypothetical protein